jgi:phosphoserine phosphatase
MLDSIAFGDSMSDYPLFRALSHTVAVNSDDELSRLARMTYHGFDLYDACFLSADTSIPAATGDQNTTRA